MPPEDLNSIDVSQLDALTKLDADHRAIQSLSNKAAWRRDKEVEIYSRVVADYEARMAAIADQATPVRQRVRDDLDKLQALYQRYEKALDQAKGKLQECEFRHEIGEFTVEQFEECQQAAELAMGERESEFEAVRKLRLRYLELLPNEPAPAPRAPAIPAAAAPEPVPPPVVAAPAPPPPAPAPTPFASAPTQAVPASVWPTESPAPVVPPPPPVPPPPAPPVGGTVTAVPAETPDNATIFLRPPSTDDFKLPAAAKGAADANAFDTISVSSAMLIEDRGGLPGTHHRLGVTTSIGRTPDNQIVVPIKEVSRRHARVVMTDGGYVLKDLGSPNGTFVNGQRVTEQRLQEGDKITMGGKVFVFTGPS